MTILKYITKKQIIYTTLILIWMATVFSFSNQPAVESSKTSGGITETVAKIIIVDPEKRTPETISRIETIIRKLAHFNIYTIGGFLIAGLVNTTNPTTKKLIIYSILFTTLYACTDEIHQLFVEGRSGEIRDIIIDGLGATLGTMIFLLIKQLLTAKNKMPQI